MKRALIFCGLLLLYSAANSQNIVYEKSFDDALEKAKTEKKIVLLIITSPTKFNKVNFPQFPKTAFFPIGLDNPEVIKLYNKNFINYTVTYIDSISIQLLKKVPC